MVEEEGYMGLVPSHTRRRGPDDPGVGGTDDLGDCLDRLKVL